MMKKLEVLWGYIVSRWVCYRKKRSLPVVVNFSITDNCNSRCIMCNVWSETVSGELEVEDIARIFSSEVFSGVRHVGISGGEPTLRKDLVDCVKAIVQNAPSLKTLSITTHGYHTFRWSRFIPELKAILADAGVRFSVNISIDGVGEKHDIVRGTKGAFDRAIRTAEIVRSHDVPVQLQSTIGKLNLYNVGKILRFSSINGFDVVFRKAVEISRLDNSSVITSVGLDPDEDSYLADFFRSERLLEKTTSSSRRIYYRKMAGTLQNGGERNRPCYFQYQGVFLGSAGDIYNCSLSGAPIGNLKSSDDMFQTYFSQRADQITKELVCNDCRKCYHDQGGAWSASDIALDFLSSKRIVSRLVTLALKSLAIAGNTLRSHVVLLLGPFCCHKPNIAADKKNAYVIGAYGGEHVGDAAILGGVCIRLADQHNIECVYVESFRPSRTKKWVKGLQLPVKIQVVGVGSVEARKSFSMASMVVYGGGPLMEIPYQLSRHLLTLSRAVNSDKTVLVEGVGLGPIKTIYSRYVIKKILSLADGVCVRTHADLEVARGMSVSPSRANDPAFDYLGSVKSNIVKNASDGSGFAKFGIDHDHQVIGVNIRPLWEKYNLSKGGKSLEDVYGQFVRQLCCGLSEYSSQKSGRVTFLFLPMNPDQYGFSDLDSAYDIEDQLDGVNYIIFENESDVMELAEIMSYLDVMISMRFHGCIFALAMGVPKVIGIDYQIGKNGKVTSVMNDAGLDNHVCPVDKFSSSWLVSKLTA